MFTLFLPFQRSLRALGVALLFCSLSLPTVSLAYSVEDIPSYTLRYSVTYRGSAIGELEIQIKKQAGEVIVRGETFPNALASLFGDGKVIETIKYTQQGDKLLLTRLTQQKGQSNPKTSELIVDRDKNTLLTRDKQITIAKDDQIDAYTFPLLSILGLNDSASGSEEKLVTAEKVREYRYHEPSHETITTQAGTFKTLKTSKTRLDKPKTIALWLTETQPFMPVQIQVDKKGKPEVSIKLIKAE